VVNGQAIRSIIRKAGIVGLAKAISSDGDPRGLDEHSWVDLVTSHALCEHPRLSGAQAFSKEFTEQSPEGALLRQPHAIVKRGQFAEPEDDDSDRDEAIRELQEIGKRKWPSLKPPQQFSRAY
jgi:hypothetical protein